MVSRDIIQKIKKHVFDLNIHKDTQLLSSTGYNEVEGNYKVKTHAECPKNIFIVSKIMQFQGNSLIGSKYGVYPFTLKGDFDKGFNVDQKCKGVWFLKLKDFETV